MVLEAIVEFLFSVIAQLLMEVLLICIGYWPGWLILKILTLGKYPPPGAEKHNEYFVGCIPYFLLLILLTIHYS